MYFKSTRNGKDRVKYKISDAMLKGLANDGGLLVPSTFPLINWKNLDNDITFKDFTKIFLQPFFKGDILEKSINDICNDCFNFSLPVHHLDNNFSVLELFHGPTLSFKDFGARFLASCIERIPKDKIMTILVATSGDTGSAVASAFFNRKNIRVVILFPENKITQRQQDQMTCWGENILTIAVKGNFDDCQRLVKLSFSDAWWAKNTMLNTSNSINIGRILPQATYYAYSSFIHYQYRHETSNFIVPSGNIGNITSAYWSKICGFPIDSIIAAQNANNTISSYVESDIYPNSDTIETVANAMDVGKPSNFERLVDLFDNRDRFKENVKAISVDDENIIKQIYSTYRKFDYIICPHTATAFFAHEKINRESLKNWIMIATADPSKFEKIISRSINIDLEPCNRLKELLSRKKHFFSIDPTMNDLKALYKQFFL